MTVKRRVVFPDGGFMLDGYVWMVQNRIGTGVVKQPVFVVVDQDDNATLYADHDCTERLGSARRGVKL